MPNLGPPYEAEPVTPWPWETESPVPAGPYPVPAPASIDPLGGGEQPWVDFAAPSLPAAPPDLGAALAAGAAAIPRPQVIEGEPDVQPWDPMPREVDPESPVVAAYDEPPVDTASTPWAGRDDVADLAGSETFAPEYDANPEGAEADQAWASEQDRQAGIDATAAEYDRLDPIAFADMQGKRRLAEEHRRATLELETAERDRTTLEDNIKRREMARGRAQREIAEVTTAAREMADGSPFAGWWADRSIPQQVVGIFGSMFAGLGQGVAGPNSVIDHMFKLAEGDAEQKWKKIETRRKLAGDAMVDADADFREREAIRLASYEQMVRAIEGQIAQLDPEGSAAEKLSIVHRAAASKMGEAAAALEAQRFDRADKMIKADQEQQKIDLDRDKAIAADQLARAKFARAGAGGGKPSGLFGDKTTYTAAQWAVIEPSLKGVLDRFDPATPMTGKDITDLQKITGSASQASIEAAREENVRQGTRIEKEKLESGRGIAFNGSDIYQYEADGKTVKLDEFGQPQKLLAPTEPEGTEIRKKISNSVRVANLLDDAAALRDGASISDLKWPGSKVRQDLRGIAKEIVSKTKEGMQGMSSDADMVNIATSRGVDGLTDYLSQEGAIERGRANVVDGLNTDMVQRFKYKGPALLIPNPHAAGPRRASVTDDATARLSGKGDYASTLSSPKRFVKGIAGRTEPVMTDDQKSAQELLTASLDRPKDPDAPAAAAGLISAALGGANSVARASAARALWDRRKAGNHAAIAAYEKLDEGQKAQFLVRLPKAEAYEELRILSGAADDDEPAGAD